MRIVTCRHCGKRIRLHGKTDWPLEGLTIARHVARCSAPLAHSAYHTIAEFCQRQKLVNAVIVQTQA